MPDPLRVISMQAHKARLSEHEQAALETARIRKRVYGVFGLAFGGGLGYFLTRRTKSRLMKGFAIFFNSTFFGSLSSNYALLTSIKELSNEQKYPNITASMRDISKEIMQASGYDPNNPESRRLPRHRPDFEHLPPSVPGSGNAQHRGPKSPYDDFGTSDGGDQQHEFGNPALENAQEQYEFGNPALKQSKEQQHEFGNPALEKFQDQPQAVAGNEGTAQDRQYGQQQQQIAPAKSNTWDDIRKGANRNDNAWDRLRKQSGQQQDNTAQQFGDVWGSLGQNGGFEGSDSSGSGGFGSDTPSPSTSDFPRSREDFQDDWRRSGSSGSSGAFST
ncbi:hypothetical protein H4S01_001993 [Coemansia sp. RSA 2610]|nr:hypothetical protein H4S01_001993 [Coemansia sp. RSA 2610]